MEFLVLCTISKHTLHTLKKKTLEEHSATRSLSSNNMSLIHDMSATWIAASCALNGGISRDRIDYLRLNVRIQTLLAVDHLRPKHMTAQAASCPLLHTHDFYVV